MAHIVPQGPSWSSEAHLKTHVVGKYFKPHFRPTGGTARLALYVFEMGSYALATAWRVAGLVKDLIVFIVTLILGVFSVGYFASLDDVKKRGFNVLISFGEVGIGILGIFCPPAAVYLDEKIQSTTEATSGTFPWNISFFGDSNWVGLPSPQPQSTTQPQVPNETDLDANKTIDSCDNRELDHVKKSFDALFSSIKEANNYAKKHDPQWDPVNKSIDQIFVIGLGFAFFWYDKKKIGDLSNETLTPYFVTVMTQKAKTMKFEERETTKIIDLPTMKVLQELEEKINQLLEKIQFVSRDEFLRVIYAIFKNRPLGGHYEHVRASIMELSNEAQLAGDVVLYSYSAPLVTKALNDLFREG